MPPPKKEFKLRPDKPGGTLKEASRIYVRKEVMFDITGAAAENGRPCVIERVGEGDRNRTEAVLYASPDPNTAKNIAKISPALLEASGLTLSDMVQITGMGDSVPGAEQVVLEEIPGDVARGANDPDRDDHGWRGAVRACLNGILTLFPGMILKDLKWGDDTRSFKIVSVNQRTRNIVQYRPGKTEIVLGVPKEDDQTKPRPKLEITGVSGIDEAVQRLNDFLSAFSVNDVPRSKSAAVVLHGGSGTGKTMLINHIVNLGWGIVHRIDPDEKLSSIREILVRAKEQQPSILVFDEFHRLLNSKERSNCTALISTLCKFLDQLHKDIRDDATQTPEVLVLVACRDYATDVPEDLRLAGRLPDEIFLPLPDVACRRAILESIKPHLPPKDRDVLLTEWSQRTHAYNGHDLVKLVDRTALVSHVYHRDNPIQTSWSDGNGSENLPEKPQADGTITPKRPYIHPSSFDQAIKHVRPSAMHEVNLKPPPVYWSDIGGQESVKLALRSAVQLLNTPAETLRSFGISPPKGVLLYGPPGCSKTMAAQAMATESGLNFFAVKGAELLNSYVGESERAVRNLFARVRAAAPAMVFFDEIDSIGAKRGGGAEKTTTHGGLNVLTTLLNEMDGFEDMKDVLVLAATNRPHALDPALLRPGRFDQIIYVPPPDAPARRAILGAALKRTRAEEGTDLEELVVRTEGYSGAEIAGISKAAAMKAFMRDGEKAVVGMGDYATAIGAARMMITEDMLNGYRKWEERFE